MSGYTFNPHAQRVAKARFATFFGAGADMILLAFIVLSAAGAGLLLLSNNKIGLSLLGFAALILVFRTWVKHDLHRLTPATIGSTNKLDLLLPNTLVYRYHPDMTASQVWAMLTASNETVFLIQRFHLPSGQIGATMASWTLDHEVWWTETERICREIEQPFISAGPAVVALFHLNPALNQMLSAIKLTAADLDEGARWVHRLHEYTSAERPLYGGIARDWAAGFTPTLSQYGTNLSSQVEYAGQHAGIQERTSQLDALTTGLVNGTGSVVLVGDPGIGKSALLLGLADHLLQGDVGPTLMHHQVFSLNASLILSNTKGQGDIERIVLNVLNEAVHAGNIVLALDEAQLFFGQGTGAVNLSQILLPILQTRRVKIVLAVSAGDWQKLRATNTAMTSMLTPLVLAEPDQVSTIRILSDRALTFEGPYTTTWSALEEAYRLSGRYLQDEAYPGKALKLLEAASNYPDGAFISERSVEQAVESQFGVKVQTASSGESDALLHLEDKIHERMINQTRAVSVIANALRRARAGVANPKRPIGSFLFLGPTGVGKTELARSIAALYFGAEENMVRLDMSEYQQVADVDRLLASGANNPEGLLSKIRQAPFSVVLLDEIEKAHPNILNLLLQMLDEGALTDTTDHPASFRDAIIIATSNAGADEIRTRIEAGQALESFDQQFTDHLISGGAFKPELLNRFDEIVLFRPLNETELVQVVQLMIKEVNTTLANQNITVELTTEAAAMLVKSGYDPRLGARPMRRMVTRRVEDAVAGLILRGEAKPGDVIKLNSQNLSLTK